MDRGGFEFAGENWSEQSHDTDTGLDTVVRETHLRGTMRFREVQIMLDGDWRGKN